jgi:hypothetical protein
LADKSHGGDGVGRFDQGRSRLAGGVNVTATEVGVNEEDGSKSGASGSACSSKRKALCREGHCLVVTSQGEHAEHGIGGKGRLIERTQPDRRHFVPGSGHEVVGPVQKMGAVSFVAEDGKAPGLQRVEPSGQGWMAGALDHLLAGTGERDGLLWPPGFQRQMIEAAVDQTGKGGFAARLGEDKRLLEVPLRQDVVARIVSHPAGEIGQAYRGTKHLVPVSGWFGAKETWTDFDRQVTHNGAVHVCPSEHPVGRTELREKLDIMRLRV